ncbi:hypothetical protein [Bosea sp. (in: a-proteobacteria)]|uniref:hypothetical protein n=1 Tax=Bosea sp. (in: a-proteobacteria) TaxID=1871050 RepID=UPI00260B4848|nr:hypothetical protein [Bosea sp. (in: a-proteobacteria)]MCO5091984.1 hypothetical protein [Bosea sp. (in: a-proteobacteria)]
MKREMAAAALLLVASGALAQAPKAEGVIAYTELISCLERSADQLDDNRSDAATIARAAMAKCREALASFHAIRRGIPAQSDAVAQDMATPELKEWFLDRATIAALERRAARKP